MDEVLGTNHLVMEILSHCWFSLRIHTRVSEAPLLLLGAYDVVDHPPEKAHSDSQRHAD